MRSIQCWYQIARLMAFREDLHDPSSERAPWYHIAKGNKQRTAKKGRYSKLSSRAKDRECVITLSDSRFGVSAIYERQLLLCPPPDSLEVAHTEHEQLYSCKGLSHGRHRRRTA